MAPPKKKYHMRRNMKRKYNRYRKKKGLNKSQYKTVSKMIQSKIQKNQDPQQVYHEIGTYNLNTGLKVSPAALQPGVLGVSTADREFPEIAMSESIVGGLGNVVIERKPGTRIDNKINCTGVSIKGSIYLPAQLDYAYITMYFGTAKEPVNTQWFAVPDGVDNVNQRFQNASTYRKIYYSKTIKISHSVEHGASPDETVRKINFFRKFKTPIQIEYANTQSNSWVGRRFFVFWKCSCQQVGAVQPNVIMKYTTYYRDQ